MKALRALQHRAELGLLDPLDFRVQVLARSEGGDDCTFTRCAALTVLRSIGESEVFQLMHIFGNIALVITGRRDFGISQAK